MKYSTKITYLTYLLNNVSEDYIKQLICFMYDKKEFFNPYDTYKEFLLNLYLDNPDDIDFLQNFSIYYLENNLNKSILNNSKNDKMMSEIFKVDPKFDEILSKISPTIIEKLKNFKYECDGNYYKFINLKPSNIDTHEIIKNCFVNPKRENYNYCYDRVFIDKMLESMNSFEFVINENSKKYINNLFKSYIDVLKTYKMFCTYHKEYTVDSQNKKLRKPLTDVITITSTSLPKDIETKEEDIYQLIEDSNKLYIGLYDDLDTLTEIKGYPSLRGDNCPLLKGSPKAGITNRIKAIMDAIDEVKKLKENNTKALCSICRTKRYMFDKRNKNKNIRTCSVCNRIIKYISDENISGYDSKYIRSQIRGSKSDSEEKQRRDHLKNLRELLKELGCRLKDKDRIEREIKKVFDR